MKSVDRANYVLDKRHAYEDSPQCVLIAPSFLRARSHRPRVCLNTYQIDRARCDYLCATHGASRVPPLSLLLAKTPLPTHVRTRANPDQHAHAAELLLPYLRPGARVLDVGAGSGYLTSVLYRLVDLHDGTVVGIEHVPALTALAESNIRADGLGPALDRQAVVLVTGDGRLGALPPSF